MIKNIQINIKPLLSVVCISLFMHTANAQIQIGGDIDGEAANEHSGHSVSMTDGYTVAIGAPYSYGNGVHSGQVRIYSWQDTAWIQKGDDINGEAIFDLSGHSVSMPDSNTVAIGARSNGGTGTNAGHVRIYKWEDTEWVQKGNDIDGEAMSDQAGYSVCMPDANTVAIGATRNDGAASDAGHVRIYKWEGNTWMQKGLDIDGEAANDQSGHSVSMPDANTVAIGAPYNSGNIKDAGHVRIYTWNGTAWTQKGIDLEGEGTTDQFGFATSMPDANTVAIGAPRNDGNGSLSGHVRIFKWNGTAWVQQGSDIDSERYSDGSGCSVSMPNPNTVAIGARGNLDNGIRAGHVRIYDWTGTAWRQRDSDIDGEAANDLFGEAVSMPNDSTVAIGASRNDATASNAGHVRIYSLCPADRTHKVTACGSYTWDGVTYTTSNNSAADTIMSAAGCVSVVRLDLIISNPTASSQTVKACDSYTWIDGNTYSTSTDSATHTLTSAAGCDSVVTLNLTIDTAGVSVTNNTPTLIAKTTGAAYQWIDCDNNNSAISGEINASFTASINGRYAVEVTQNGCTDTSVCIEIKNASILENSFSAGLLVYPNPTKRVLSIDLGTAYSGVTVVVRNTLGQEVQRTNLPSSQHIILILEEPKGIYFVEVKAGAKKAILKVVKE